MYEYPILEIHSKNGRNHPAWYLWNSAEDGDYSTKPDAIPGGRINGISWDVATLTSELHLRLKQAFIDNGETLFPKHPHFWIGCSSGANIVPDGRYINSSWMPRHEFQALDASFWRRCVEITRLLEDLEEDKALLTFVDFFCNGGCCILSELKAKYVVQPTYKIV